MFTTRRCLASGANAPDGVGTEPLGPGLARAELGVPILDGCSDVEDDDGDGALQAVARTRMVRTRETVCVSHGARRMKSEWHRFTHNLSIHDRAATSDVLRG